MEIEGKERRGESDKDREGGFGKNFRTRTQSLNT